MASPVQFDELVAAGSLSAGAAVAVVQGNDTFRTTPRAFITEAESFTQRGTGAVARAMQEKGREIFSAFDFMTAAQIADVQAGSIAVDVAAALRAAFVACNAAGGGTVYLPAGDYRLESGFDWAAFSNIHVLGDGPNATSLWVVGNSIIVFNVTGVSTRLMFEDLWIGSGSARTGTGGIHVTGTSSSSVASEIYVNRVSVQNLNEPYKWQHVHQSRIENSRAMQSVTSGITSHGLYFFDVVSTRVHDLIVLVTTGSLGGDYVRIDGDCDTIILDGVEGHGGTTGVGFRFQQGAGSTGPRLTKAVNCYSEIATSSGFLVSAGRDVRLTNCHSAVNGAEGFLISGGTSVVCEGCLSLQNNTYGFLITGGDGTGIINCTASDNSQATDNAVDGIRIENNVTHARIIGCRSGDFVLSLTNDQRYGLSIGATGTDYIVAIGNDLQGNQTGSLGNFSGGANNQISLNAV